MTVGIQVWDAAGNLILDWTDSVAKVLGEASIGTSYTGATQTGTITDTRFTSMTGHTPFFCVISGDSWNVELSPTFSISGNVLSWNFPHATQRPDTVFIYGVA